MLKTYNSSGGFVRSGNKNCFAGYAIHVDASSAFYVVHVYVTVFGN